MKGICSDLRASVLLITKAFGLVYRNRSRPTSISIGMETFAVKVSQRAILSCRWGWQASEDGRSLQKLGPSIKIQIRSEQTNFLKNEWISDKHLNPRPYKPVPGVLFTTIHRISQKYLRRTILNPWPSMPMPGVLFTILHKDFTAIPHISHLHKGLGSERCHFGLAFFT